MPVFVQWKWRERRTKSDFLVVFHFIDNESKLNLRTVDPKEFRFREARSWMTWAPSHPEESWLAEVLRIANMVNGLKEHTLVRLRDTLEGKNTEVGYNLMKALPDKAYFYIYNQQREVKAFCVQLCPEYIAYVKEVLKPYIS